ncbi:MAG TPA: bi-domain-containing oxidoreductase, partial [Burkholderiales bacterium]|nr:bi-domain-containing oxidoreductase [Burkholderiales bacterium]
MRQVTQNYKSGEIRLQEVDWPALKPGGVLVRSHYSVISTGTEGMKVREGKLSYLGKARARPDQLKKVLNTLKQQGFVATYQKVMNKLDSLTPLGYSLAGEVVAVGADAGEFHVGQRVACAGAGYANHADVNYVPKNLVVAVPDNVSLKHASFATVGAIAMQGFRQAELQLGESACVIGLGLLGQLLVQILKAAGIHAVGTDIVESRCRLAEELGARGALTAGDPGLEAMIARLTGGVGVDCVFIAAGGASNAATELAVRIARDRARVVDIGKTRLDLPWNDYYLKELDVRFSRSYGPGRYDPNYEERGIDYPIGYVRWTERRNLASFLDLVNSKLVQIEPLISQVRAFGEAETVYKEMAEGAGNVLSVVFEYEKAAEPLRREAPRLKLVKKTSGQVRIGVIGAGAYACSMLLPPLKRNPDAALVSVATTTPLSGQNAKRHFGFGIATTDYREVLQDPDIDAVLIATRHSSHARLVAEALRAGKTTYVEKPLAITTEDLAVVRKAIEESGNDRLMVGFNRRFSPMIGALAGCFRKNFPIVAHYRVHAGQLDKGSWYLDPSEGSRFAGEAGHFIDVLSYLVGARPLSVMAARLKPANPTADDLDNVCALVRYADGSVATLQYLTQGALKVPKEYLEVFGGGVTAQMHNFESLLVFEQERQKKLSMRLDKGQQAEMDAFVDAVKR